ncbi:hypothetical protein RRG08_037561 [Elysia crispata]|uniref:Uncharacterized protein n=1 Tax=Elysia crispata TaxID=231223 RepID=A0AAE0Y5Y3_9GAST|nr:hypothetical protein RRG08_037561 [Elysia crispata]
MRSTTGRSRYAHAHYLFGCDEGVSCQVIARKVRWPPPTCVLFFFSSRHNLLTRAVSWALKLSVFGRENVTDNQRLTDWYSSQLFRYF